MRRLLILLTVLMLAACGGTPPATPPPATAPPTEAPPATEPPTRTPAPTPEPTAAVDEARREARDATGAQAVALNAPGTLTLIQGVPESLLIEAAPELLPQIETGLEDGILTIGGALPPQADITYTLTLPTLQVLTVNGPATVTAGRLSTQALIVDLDGAQALTIEELRANELEIRDAGAATITIQGGEVGSQRIIVLGEGEYTAPDLRSAIADVVVAADGTVTLWAVEQLAVSIGGTGSVAYYGSPALTEQAVGDGTLTPLGEKD